MHCSLDKVTYKKTDINLLPNDILRISSLINYLKVEVNQKKKNRISADIKSAILYYTSYQYFVESTSLHLHPLIKSYLYSSKKSNA